MVDDPVAGRETPLVDSDQVEDALLGRRTFTRAEVAAKADVPLELAEQLWGWLGFPHAADDDLAFTRRDLKALRRTTELMGLGVLDEESQSALVRTWGRSFARLAEWQVDLLAGLAAEDEDPEARLQELMATVLPNVEKLQAYVWRRHLASAAGRLIGDDSGTSVTETVGFVDIVGYTSRSRNLTDLELVELVEEFEATMTTLVVDHRGRVIKTIGDEVLFVCGDPFDAAEVALQATERGEDDEATFPRVRAGLAHGPVVSRLGDVFGPTVNLAARLTSVARPGTVLVDRDAMECLSGNPAEPTDPGEPPDRPLERLLDAAADELTPYRRTDGFRFRRLPRRPVKGYKRLEPWLLRRHAR